MIPGSVSQKPSFPPLCNARVMTNTEGETETDTEKDRYIKGQRETEKKTGGRERVEGSWMRR